MPSIDWNRHVWQEKYDWDSAGEDWSATWGTSRAEWDNCIYPRIRAFLPANSVLEIAPGFGRWTEYLLPYCGNYVGVDLSERCVVACQNRFADRKNARFFANDGFSLQNIADKSIDFIFSFDSLVHSEDDVINAYLKEFRRILTDDGVAFIHHSNLGAYRSVVTWGNCAAVASRRLAAFRQHVPQRWTAVARTRGLRHCRASSMTGDRFCELADQAGLTCIGQEMIAWLVPYLIDCISIVTLPGSKWERDNIRVKNWKFAAAARSAAAVAKIYDF